MTQPKSKEVRFDKYCDKCKNYKTEEYREPCNSCLTQFFNEGTDKPINFKEDKNREHLAKELGDVAWYLAVSADALGYSLEEILKMNVEKLRARYPDGFEAERSVNREEGDL